MMKLGQPTTHFSNDSIIGNLAAAAALPQGLAGNNNHLYGEKERRNSSPA